MKELAIDRPTRGVLITVVMDYGGEAKAVSMKYPSIGLALSMKGLARVTALALKAFKTYHGYPVKGLKLKSSAKDFKAYLWVIMAEEKVTTVMCKSVGTLRKALTKATMAKLASHAMISFRNSDKDRAKEIKTQKAKPRVADLYDETGKLLERGRDN